MQIIVTGHGKFASGIQSTVKLLAGQLKNVAFIDFTAEMDEQQLAAAFKKQLAADPEAVFYCDLFGGTPFKEAAKLTPDFPKIAVMAGGNVSALLEIALPGLDSYANANDLADKLMTTAASGIKKFEHHHLQTESDGDGI